MRIAISSALAGRLVALAAAEPDREVCGLLLGDESGPAIGAIQPAANVADDPTRAFELDPAVLLAAYRHARAGGPAILGHYHSHPAGPARPSPRDAAAAGEAGLVWLILARGEMTAWCAVPGGPVEGVFAPVELVVVG